MLRKTSSAFLIFLALLAGAFWVTAFLAETPHGARAAAELGALTHTRQVQIAALGIAAPLAFVAAVLALFRARYAAAACLVTSAYVVGSFFFVTRAPNAIFKPDPIVAWVYCGVWVVPLLTAGIATFIARRPKEQPQT